jgi:hypothetical protein
MLAQAVESYLAVRRACGEENHCFLKMLGQYSRLRLTISVCSVYWGNLAPRLTRYVTHSPSEPWKPARLTAITSQNIYWRRQPISVIVRFPLPTGIWKQRRI